MWVRRTRREISRCVVNNRCWAIQLRRGCDMARGGIGATLASLGQDQKRESVDMLGKAADEETQRNAHNKVMAAQAKAGGQQFGATAGALAGGQFFGPWGAVVGGAIGAIAGGELF